jgi:hypothetical protein
VCGARTFAIELKIAMLGDCELPLSSKALASSVVATAIVSFSEPRYPTVASAPAKSFVCVIQGPMMTTPSP